MELLDEKALINKIRQACRNNEQDKGRIFGLIWLCAFTFKIGVLEQFNLAPCDTLVSHEK